MTSPGVSVEALNLLGSAAPRRDDLALLEERVGQCYSRIERCGSCITQIKHVTLHLFGGKLADISLAALPNAGIVHSLSSGMRM